MPRAPFSGPDMSAEPAQITLELSCAPALRLPRRWALSQPIIWPRGRAVSLIWHDTPRDLLTARGRMVVQAGRLWQLRDLWTDSAHLGWAGPGPLLAEARSAAALPDITTPLAPFASFAGRQQDLTLEWDGAPVALTLIQGTITWFAGAVPVTHLILRGPPPQIQALGIALAGLMPLRPATGPLAVQALVLARGSAWPPNLPAAPRAGTDATLAESLEGMVRSLVTALLWSMADIDRLADAEVVHRTRVSVRRLRSLLAAYAAVLDPAATPRIRQLLRETAARLASVRAWDVYLDAPAERLRQAFPDHPAVERLLQAARRRRREAHAALHDWGDGAAWRADAISLAIWAGGIRVAPDPDHPEAAPWPVAAARLGRWLHRLEKFGDLDQIPPSRLHDARKLAKKIRYLIDFNSDISPQKPAGRLAKRLAELQEALGILNDATELPLLLAQLGPVGKGWAAGAAAGLAAAEASATLPVALRAWKRLWEVKPFWDKDRQAD